MRARGSVSTATNRAPCGWRLWVSSAGSRAWPSSGRWCRSSSSILGLTPVQAGLLAGIPNLTGSLLRIPFGAWVDKAGGRLPFLTLLGLTLAGYVRVAGPDRHLLPGQHGGMFPVLLLLGVLIGSGIATFSVGIPQVSYWFPKRQQGGPLGIYAGLGNTAPGLFSLLLPAAVAVCSAYWSPTGSGLWARRYRPRLRGLHAGRSLVPATASRDRQIDEEQLAIAGLRPHPDRLHLGRTEGVPPESRRPGRWCTSTSSPSAVFWL